MSVSILSPLRALANLILTELEEVVLLLPLAQMSQSRHRELSNLP